MRVFPIRARLARLDCIHILEHPCPKRDVISLLDLPTSITTRPEQVQPEPHLHIEPAHPASPSCRERIERTRRFSAFHPRCLGCKLVCYLYHSACREIMPDTWRPTGAAVLASRQLAACSASTPSTGS